MKEQTVAAVKTTIAVIGVGKYTKFVDVTGVNPEKVAKAYPNQDATLLGLIPGDLWFGDEARSWTYYALRPLRNTPLQSGPHTIELSWDFVVPGLHTLGWTIDSAGHWYAPGMQELKGDPCTC